MRNQVTMTEARRKLLLHLFDGYQPILPFLCELDLLIAKHKRNDVYHWLIGQDLKGKRLYDYLLEHDMSRLKMLRSVLTKIEKYKKRELIAGVDLS